MPFQSDEQRKAAFANMRGRGGGGGPRTPGTPRPPKAPKTPKPKKPKKPRTGYAGNYLNGLPDWSNWYDSLPNTTQEGSTPLAPYGSNIGGYGSIPAGSFNLVWEDYQGYQPREMTTAEKILLGIPVAAAMWVLAPGIGGLTAAGAAEYTFGATSGSAVAFVTTAGTQGGALGFSGLAITGIPMSVNDSPYYYRDGNVVRNSYPDLVGWLGGQIRNQSHIDYSISASGIDWTLRP